MRQLEEKGLIYTEPTMVRSKDGRPLNGNLLYTVRPIQGVLEAFYERQLRRVEEDVARYPLINLRCIQQEGTIQLKEADIYEAKEPLKEEYLSQSGDIIVRLTAPYTAVLIDETTSGMVVSSNFVVIRVEDKSLLPEYLFWLLNTEKIKRKIYENATSNMLGAVNARFLADFELVLLSVEDQRKISQFNLLAKRERQLLRMLAEEKEKYYAGVLNQAYKRAKKGK